MRWSKIGDGGEVSEELTRIQRRGQADRYVYRVRNDDGTYNSQLFVQGSDEDTVVQRHSDFGKWHAVTSNARMPDAHDQNDDIPLSSSNLQLSTDEGTVADMRGQLTELGFDASDPAAQAFMQAAGDGQPFTLAVERSTNTNGQDDARLVARRADGSTFVAARSGESFSQISQLPSVNGRQQVTATESDGETTNRTLIDASLSGEDVSVFSLDAQGRRSPQPGADEAMRAVLDGGNLGRRATSQFPNLVRYSSLLRGGRAQGATWAQASQTALAQVRESSRTTRGLGGANAVVSGALSLVHAYNMFDSFADGDTEGGFRSMTALSGSGSSGALAMQASGWLSEGAAATAGVWGKALGVVGAVGSIGFGIYDIAEGNVGRGVLGVASGVGVGMALAGSTGSTVGWMGPVGWGIAGVATVGGVIYDVADHVDATEIADINI
ncbi:MAG: hypothetical protein ACYTFT_01310 [Planctomycetota bacterium]|jgi:hypothetical protein